MIIYNVYIPAQDEVSVRDKSTARIKQDHIVCEGEAAH